jgi:hypothetical protein
MRNIPHYLNDEHMKLYEWSQGRNQLWLQPAHKSNCPPLASCLCGGADQPGS